MQGWTWEEKLPLNSCLQALVTFTYVMYGKFIFSSPPPPPPAINFQVSQNENEEHLAHGGCLISSLFPPNCAIGIWCKNARDKMCFCFYPVWFLLHLVMFFAVHKQFNFEPESVRILYLSLKRKMEQELAESYIHVEKLSLAESLHPALCHVCAKAIKRMSKRFKALLEFHQHFTIVANYGVCAGYFEMSRSKASIHHGVHAL